MTHASTLVLRKNTQRGAVDAHRVTFSPRHFLGDAAERAAPDVLDLLCQHLLAQSGLAVYGTSPLLEKLLAHCPDLAAHFVARVTDSRVDNCDAIAAPLVPPRSLSSNVQAVFIPDLEVVARMRKEMNLSDGTRVIDVLDLPELIGVEKVPEDAWQPIVQNIYPIALPDIEFETDLDLLLLDCPARNLSLMPNGLGYVHNAIKRTGIRHQTFDVDIIAYHRFHMSRLFDHGGAVTLPSGRELPTDPWSAEHYSLWQETEVFEYFMPLLDEVAEAIIKARPRAIGFSYQAANEAFTQRLARRVQEALPETVIIAGGYSCYQADIGRKAFPESDYMCIGEADLTVGSLVEALARGERPANLPGVMSRYDDPEVAFIPAPMPHNLDQIEHPKYEWFGVEIYRNYNNYQLTPVIASRGCRWARCTFCAERFYWRIRSPKNFVDELEWLVSQGCHLFMFNESDLNGMPERLVEICDEIIRRKLKVNLTGQLRIHKKGDDAFYRKLREAGFSVLRFGVDAFSHNTMRLQKKGYTPDIVRQNLKACRAAGISIEVNWVIGVPGETWEDVEEGIDFLLENRDYIWRVANINPLILANGSVYWLEPEAHDIKFRGERQALYDKYLRSLPANEWYSVEPYIDHNVRRAYFNHVVASLYEEDLVFGDWARHIIDEVREQRDRARAGASSDSANGNTRDHVTETLSHRVYRRDNRFFAVPKSFEIEDVEAIDIERPEECGVPGVYVADTIEAVLWELGERPDHVRKHASSSEARESRKENFEMRAGSMGMLEALEQSALRDPMTVRFGKEWFRFEKAALATAFAPSAMRPESERFKADPTLGQQLIRKLSRLLANTTSQNLRNRYRSYAITGGRLHAREADWLQRLMTQPAQVARLMMNGDDGLEPDAQPSMFEESGLVACWAETRGANARVVGMTADYLLHELDGVYYATPHGLEVDFHGGDALAHPLVPQSRSAAALTEALLRRDPRAAQVRPMETSRFSTAVGAGVAHRGGPKDLGVKDGYQLVSYEGWYYAVPVRYGRIDFAEQDPMELPGVIRDVAREVVELAIAEQVTPVPMAGD